MKEKTKKVLNLTGNIVSGIIFVFALVILIITLVSSSKGYVSWGGKIFLPVETNSMNGDKADSFAKGDMLVVRELTDAEKSTLQVGQIITFWQFDDVSGTLFLNSHRIVAAKLNEQSVMTYQTQGDASTMGPDRDWRLAKDIVGVYESKNSSSLGSTLLWLRSTTGFLICIVIPSFLLLGYCVYTVIKNYKEYGKSKKLVETEELREQLRLEILKEQSEKQSDGGDGKNNK